MYSNDQIARMPISEVVNLPGGNALASPAFQMPLNFFGLVGWQHVEEGVEALICDGQLVPRTNLTTDWLRALGRTKFFRRVLLQPAPLTDISAKALTKDQLELTLTVSAKYHVTDPVYVASLQAPLTELINLIVGLVAEYVRSDSLDNIISDDGKLRIELKKYLENSPTLSGHYSVTEILKALPTGDERLLEIFRQRRIAETQSGLIDAEGKNRVIKAGYEYEINQQSAILQDDLANRQHARDMEMAQAKLSADVQQSVLKAISDIASSGVDVRTVLPLLSRAVPGAANTTTSNLGEEVPLIGNSVVSGQASRIDKERATLSSLMSADQISSFEVFESQGLLKGATVKVLTYEIILTCKDDYPVTAPSVLVRFNDGKTFEPQTLWISGVSDNLAQVVVSVIPQVKLDESDSSGRQSPYRLNIDDLGELDK